MKNRFDLDAPLFPPNLSDPAMGGDGDIRKQIGWRILVVTLVAFLVIAMLAYPLQPLHGSLDKGKELYRDGKFDEAATFYRDAIQTHPADTTLVLNASTELGRSLIALKRYDEAVTTLKQTVQERPSAMDSWQMIGEAYAGEHKPKEAADAFKHVLELEPTRVHTHLLLGQAYADMGMKPEARTEWDKVIALDPHNEGQLALKLINLQNRVQKR